MKTYKVYETRFRLSMSNNEELMGICEGFAEVDESFMFEVRGTSPSFVVILSNDEKQAFRRGMSIKRKLIGHGCTPNWFKLRTKKETQEERDNRLSYDFHRRVTERSIT